MTRDLPSPDQILEELADKAVARIAALHSYDVPCAVVYDMAGGLAGYLDWIDVSTSQV